MELINSLCTAKREEIDRPLADFPVNIWEDPLTSFVVSDTKQVRETKLVGGLIGGLVTKAFY
ncbi:hypothetical protein IGI04_023703 [Brassica rapa subsp. trilocularis]|uniref:Uncharacterized protein n=1 Tax=Brassica rapa subsp. trilocularis TaxID=1813537 RepID=A0ABQ7M618_BRACM|nr:hypothetical protein IGI04_023703 [Brassica rapa subsp. trilocularis]